MNTIIKTDNDLIYSTPLAVYDAFSDIMERVNQDFENIVFDLDEGVLEYDIFGKHFKKIFDYTQGTPEIVADVMQYLFSMIDAAVNM